MKYWKDEFIVNATLNLLLTVMKVKVKLSLYRPRQALRVLGS